MAYQYDIFISYRRLGATQDWIKQYFEPLVTTHLSLNLGRDPSIFVDSQIEAGDDWPIVLGNALSASKIIILLWSKTYLESRWCSCEIGHMLEREKKFGFRANNNPKGLIFPAIINDGDTIPVQISTIQKFELQDFFKITLNMDGQKYTEFEDKIKILVGKITTALNDAPTWQADWQIDAVNSFTQQLYVQNSPNQTQLPRFSS
ncbi:TIR domain-containing protein [Hymenobacter convexus]|uniref:TIR domain-containing protein n=1 Tax=Hymenobacter sp. CA1UV-4 TaxID=3063782 RepID=UPI00271384A4|nr:TIR domain-containing protein [Hymenobacter sp. CA1UV-4]MDO7853843.1 TIR domain-containing protein [Hymenobacter sp. CA1UV-4]